jgi:hypothetical protein
VITGGPVGSSNGGDITITAGTGSFTSNGGNVTINAGPAGPGGTPFLDYWVVFENKKVWHIIFEEHQGFPLCGIHMPDKDILVHRMTEDFLGWVQRPGCSHCIQLWKDFKLAESVVDG